MSSVRDQVVAKAVALLNGAGKPAGLPVADRARTFDLDEADYPAQLVYWTQDPEERIGGPSGPLQRHDVVLVVESYAKGDATTGADEAADPIVSWAVKALADSAAFGASPEGKRLVTGIKVLGSEADYKQGRWALCSVATLFGVDFQSRVDDATLVE